MILTLSIVIFVLVVINFLLLKFSCNTTNPIMEQKPKQDMINVTSQEVKSFTKKQTTTSLAPTGS